MMTLFRNNEQGAALVLTLMIVTLVMVFVLALMGQNVNTAKQVSTTEKKIQAEHMADMGITYIKSKMNEAVNNREFTSSENVINTLAALNGNVTVNAKENRFFTVEGKKTSNKITYTSIGKVFGVTAKKEITITLNNMETGD